MNFSAFEHLDTLVFYLVSLVILVCAVMMLNFRKVIYMVLAMGGVFVGCAVLFLLLGADFVGIAQVMIYAGAITILMMFAIMLTNHEAVEPEARWSLQKAFSAIGAVVLGAVLLLVIRSTHWVVGDGRHINHGYANPVAIGLDLFREYTIPFELVSLLLLVSLVGAVLIARERKED
ncbi:NADH-quinone oxidoreductase subunit J [Alicyclobacillus sp. SP_1]|uniref:NADH-quinone oxidoreductase subunit J n=1 Tax=Alicyclobacillus sp. SP_1 TaxID=2942475 RepID=UPI0021580AB4|nr:NADH-quinone oxidoreductase subunit J [Alicyclobacillus sp. SP_1]